MDANLLEAAAMTSIRIVVFHNLPVVAEMNIIFLFLIKLEISAVVLAPYPDNRQCRADTGKHNHGNHKFLKKRTAVEVAVFANQVDDT